MAACFPRLFVEEGPDNLQIREFNRLVIVEHRLKDERVVSLQGFRMFPRDETGVVTVKSKTTEMPDPSLRLFD
jgi:hypothetical protein